MDAELKHFQAALTALGSDDEARGIAIGINQWTARHWRRNPPEILRRIIKCPELIDALRQDAEELLTPAETS